MRQPPRIEDSLRARLDRVTGAPSTAKPDEAGSAHVHEPGVGQNAANPSEIPSKGWWSIAKRVAIESNEDRVMTEAAGITFYALLSLFPAMTAMVSLFGLFADRQTISEHLGDLQGVLPQGGMSIISDQLERLLASPQQALGFGAIVGLLAALWSANQGTKAMLDALNVVYEETEKRSFLFRTALSLAMTLGALVFVLVALGAIVVLPLVLKFIWLGEGVETILSLARWPIMLVGMTMLLAVLYRYGPSRELARWRWVTYGGVFAAVTWLAASAGFTWYVANFGNYDATYGSLGAIIGFMTWIWISSIVVLVGAELNAEMEHQTARDSTTGPERKLGQRGAVMADNVAEN
jgi:membrane protein